MDFLNIDKESLIENLIRDNKINVVREAVVNNDYEQMIKNERLNYCTEDELMKILSTEDNLISVMENYRLNSCIILRIFKDYLNYSKAVKKIIVDYIEILEPQHFELLIENPKYKSTIIEHNKKANYESTIYLSKKNMITAATSRQTAIIVGEKYINVDVRNLEYSKVLAAAYVNKFSKDDLEYVINMILGYKEDLKYKGGMDTILHTQEVPDKYLEKIVKEWEYTSDEPWFGRLLAHQKLDAIIDYILENVKLREKEIILILENKKTSPRKLIRLYEKYADIINTINPSRLPVLDCHSHMC